ncbi:MAG TPA: hypothetical protein PKA55_11865 [Rhodoblastus sp.]|nr:hypothetical protein [Rhodoblastus sp.]
MSDPRNPARRAFLLLASTFAVVVRPLRAAAQRGGDNGIGGTGYAPPVSERDNGLGGTGVVGTIRRFGSIYVNEARIAYPRNARVTIDGRPARAGDLRIGHVVTLIAEGPRDALATHAIAVAHEVIGPVESLSGRRAKILGQDVILPKGAKAKRGQTLAVSGLRTPDRTIAASLIERAPAGRSLVTGLVERGADGGLTIGGLAIEGVGADAVGRRMRLSGVLQDRVFVVAAADAVAVAPQGAKRLLLETYASAAGAEVTTPEGFAAVIARGAELLNGAARVVLSAERSADGGWTVQSTRVLDAGPLPGAPGGPGGFGPPGPGAPPGGAGGPGGPGAPPAPGAPAAPSAPGASGGPNLPGWPGGPGGVGGPGGFGGGPGGFGGGPGGFGGGPGGFGGGGRR